MLQGGYQPEGVITLPLDCRQRTTLPRQGVAQGLEHLVLGSEFLGLSIELVDAIGELATFGFAIVCPATRVALSGLCGGQVVLDGSHPPAVARSP